MSLLSNFFVRVVLALAVIALLAFDGIECAIAHVGGEDDANNAAYSAAQSWNTSHNIGMVLAAAKSQLHDGEHLVACTAQSTDGQTWTCTLVRKARTVLFGHLGFMKQMTTAHETGTGTYEP